MSGPLPFWNGFKREGKGGTGDTDNLQSSQYTERKRETNKNFVILKVGAFPLRPNTDGKDSVQRDSVCLLSTGQCMFIQVTRKKQEVKKLILGYKIV